MVKRSILLYGLILLSLFGGNLWAMPNWMNGRPSKFPPETYFVGVGEGDTREKAESAAFANLAKVFYAEIHQETDQQEDYRTDSENETHQQEMNVHTTVSTHKTLEGAEIIETDKDGSVYYALAVIDRIKTEKHLTEKIRDLDRDIRTAMDTAESASDKRVRIKNYKKAMAASAQREAYNMDLAIVSVTGRDIPEPISSMAIEQSMGSGLSDFLVYVQVAGPHEEILQNAIMEGMEQEGIAANPLPEATPDEPNSDPPIGDLLIKGNMTLEPVTLTGQPFKYIRWCVALTFHEMAQNKVVGVIGLSGREGHQSVEEAKARALRVLQPKVSDEVKARLSDYLSGVSPSTKNAPPSCVSDPS